MRLLASANPSIQDNISLVVAVLVVSMPRGERCAPRGLKVLVSATAPPMAEPVSRGVVEEELGTARGPVVVTVTPWLGRVYAAGVGADCMEAQGRISHNEDCPFERVVHEQV
jgi:hypothetical protein